MAILSWILFGLVVGIIAKLLMPGRDPGGFIITVLLGILGALLGDPAAVVSFSAALGQANYEMIRQPASIAARIKRGYEPAEEPSWPITDRPGGGRGKWPSYIAFFRSYTTTRNGFQRIAFPGLRTKGVSKAHWIQSPVGHSKRMENKAPFRYLP